MKTEAEITKMLIQVSEQARKNKDNLSLVLKLSERYLALQWVIDMEGAPETLTFSESDIDLLDCLW